MPSNASAGYVGIATEAVVGTAITTPDFLYPATDVDFTFENEYIEFAEIRASRQAMQIQDGPIRPEASLSGAIYPGGALALILRGLLGDVDSELAASSTTAYEHTFVDAAVLPSYTLERSTGFSGDAGVFTERVAGCKVESVGFDCTFGEQVSFDASFQATKEPVLATPITRGSAVFPTMRPLYFAGSSVKVNGVASALFKSFQLEISNTLERQETLNGTRAANSIFEGGLSVTFSGTMQFEDLTYYNYLKNSTDLEIDLHMDSGQFADQTNNHKFGLDFNMPFVRIQRYGVPFTAGEVIEADVDFKVTYSPTDLKTIGIVMTNLEEGDDYV